MQINSDTKIADIIKEYPFMREKLAEFNPMYKNLSNPIVFNTVGKFAKISDVCKMSNVDEEKFINFLNDTINNSVNAQFLITRIIAISNNNYFFILRKSNYLYNDGIIGINAIEYKFIYFNNIAKKEALLK